MRDDAVRLGLLYPGGGAEQDYDLFGEGVRACTSGSFIVGRRGAERQAEAIREVAGVPASSTSLAFARARSTLGLRRVAVLAPYPEPASRAFVPALGA